MVLIIELLPTQTDCPTLNRVSCPVDVADDCIVKLQTIVVAGVLDVAGTWGSAVLPFNLLVSYDKFSLYQGIVVLGLFGSTAARDDRLVDTQSMSKR